MTVNGNCCYAESLVFYCFDECHYSGCRYTGCRGTRESVSVTNDSQLTISPGYKLPSTPFIFKIGGMGAKLSPLTNRTAHIRHL